MSSEEQDIFRAIAALLGAQRDERPTAAHIEAYHFGEGELEFYFSTDWRDPSKGRIRVALPHTWGNAITASGAPSVGFSLHRSPEALAKDIRRRWLDDARAWHRKQVAAKEAADQREAENRARVESLLEANGCSFGHDGALVKCRNTYEGHGIEFDRYDITGSRCGGFKVTVSVQDHAALYEIARVAGEDYRQHADGKP